MDRLGQNCRWRGPRPGLISPLSTTFFSRALLALVSLALVSAIIPVAPVEGQSALPPVTVTALPGGATLTASPTASAALAPAVVPSLDRLSTRTGLESHRRSCTDPRQAG